MTADNYQVVWLGGDSQRLHTGRVYTARRSRALGDFFRITLTNGERCNHLIPGNWVLIIRGPAA